MFSKRFDYEIEDNRLSKLLKEKIDAGVEVFDLTESNPTKAGFEYDRTAILKSISDGRALIYEPNPQGLEIARKAITQYYLERNIRINTENIYLTSGTSEAYSFIFKLLTDPEDEILIPRPSYPLFSFIADMESVNVKYYDLIFEKGNSWKINFDSMINEISKKIKAIVLVNPNNPTGHFVKHEEINLLIKICKDNGIAIVCDEVFLDYDLEIEKENIMSFSEIKEVLTFTLSGLSKICGLPQMKLSWIIISGEENEVMEAKMKMDIISDTYLSVGTPIQWGAGELLKDRRIIQKQIRERITENYNFLKNNFDGKNISEVYRAEGGWYSILKIGKKIDEEILAYDLLDKKDVYIHPGYFFDFNEPGFIVVSLITLEKKFQEGIKRIQEFLDAV